MDIPATRHLGHSRFVCGSGEDDLVNLFASYFLRKEKHFTHRRSSNYNAGQDGWTGTPESSGVRKVEVHKLSAGKRVDNSIPDRGGGGGHSPTPTSYGRSWGKGMTGRKNGKS